MPSCTVPMFSNSAVSSHMIHCDMPRMRNANATATAIAPALASPWCQSHRPSAATDDSSSMLSA